MAECQFDEVYTNAEIRLTVSAIKARCMVHRRRATQHQTVAFWVTNPCRITRKVKQTKMYVCTLEEFILVDLDTLLCKLELICIGNAVVYIQSQQWMRKDEINS